MDNKPNNKGVIIKPGHPHSDGLTACYLFNDKGNTAYDFTKNENDLSVVGASFVDEGLECNASGEYASLDNSNQIVQSKKGTIIIRLKSLVPFSNTTNRGFFGYYQSSVVGTFALYKYIGRTLYFETCDTNGPHHVGLDSGYFGNWDNDIQVGCSWDKDNIVYNGKNLAMSIDGLFKVPDRIYQPTNLLSYTVNSELRVGDIQSVTHQTSNSVFKYIYIYNKVLSESTLKSIYDKPYDMFMTPYPGNKVSISYADATPVKKETLVLNESHAHAQNLVAAYPFKKCYDLRYSFNHDFSAKNNVLDTQPLAISSDGIYCGNFADYSYLNNANEPLSIDEGTIVIEFTNYISKTLQCLFGRYAISGAGDFTMMKYSDNNFYFLLNDGSGDHYVYINLSKIPNWNIDFTQIAILWRRTSAIWNSDNMVINIDGVHQVPNGQLNETSWNTGSLAAISYYIGNNSADANQYASGPIRRCYMYNTVLTEAELLSIKNDPYAMFEN